MNMFGVTMRRNKMKYFSLYVSRPDLFHHSVKKLILFNIKLSEYKIQKSNFTYQMKGKPRISKLMNYLLRKIKH